MGKHNKPAKGRPRSGSETKHDRAGLKNHRATAKNGGGGAYTWGRPGDEMDLPEMDRRDPNFDISEDIPDDSEQYILNQNGAFPTKVVQVNGYNSTVTLHDFSNLNSEPEQLRPPKLSLKEFKKAIIPAIDEYFVEEDAEDFLRTVFELDSQMLHYELVKRIITISMEKSDRERELTSKVLVELQMKKMLPVNQVAKGFERLFENVEDLKLDIPNVKRLLAQFLAKCVADEILPPAFVANPYIIKLGGTVVEHAMSMLSVSHYSTRIEHLWGLNYNSPISKLKKEIKVILLELHTTGDINEAIILIRKMNIPFFHHELVKRGIVLSMEKKDKVQALTSCFFKEMHLGGTLSTSQAVLGFQRCYQEVRDLELDNPDAKVVLDLFAGQAVKDGIMSKEQLEELKEKAKRLARVDSERLDKEIGEGGIRQRQPERRKSFA